MFVVSYLKIKVSNSKTNIWYRIFEDSEDINISDIAPRIKALKNEQKSFIRSSCTGLKW